MRLPCTAGSLAALAGGIALAVLLILIKGG